MIGVIITVRITTTTPRPAPVSSTKFCTEVFSCAVIRWLPTNGTSTSTADQAVDHRGHRRQQPDHRDRQPAQPRRRQLDDEDRGQHRDHDAQHDRDAGAQQRPVDERPGIQVIRRRRRVHARGLHVRDLRFETCPPAPARRGRRARRPAMRARRRTRSSRPHSRPRAATPRRANARRGGRARGYAGASAPAARHRQPGPALTAWRSDASAGPPPLIGIHWLEMILRAAANGPSERRTALHRALPRRNARCRRTARTAR